MTPLAVVTTVVTDMASLRKLPNSPNWIACFRLPDGRRTQRSTGTTDRAEALRIALRFEDATNLANQGRLNDVQARRVISDIYAIANRDEMNSSSIKDFLDQWLKTKELEATEKTHARYETAVGHLLGYLGTRAKKDLIHLNSKELTKFRDQLAGKLSAGSVNITLKIIRAALGHARRQGLVDVNEAERVSILKRKDSGRARRAFTLAELQKILQVADDEWRGMILIGLYTGLRLADVVGLTWSNLDMLRQEITVTTGKTGRTQILPLAKPVVEYLEGLAASDDPEAPLFPDASAAHNRSQYGGTLSNQFHRILVSAGLAKVRSKENTGKGHGARRQSSELSFHSLRHTATSLLKNAGVSDVVARDIIGHESIAVSRQYTHIETETKRRAIDMMPDVTRAD